ncbi:hypothetical protein LguiA_006012 [Lonicera macranthoides]
MRYSESATMMGFQQTTYVAMRLDNVDEPLISHNPTEEDPSQHYHQADVANITISEHFDTYQADRDIFNRFERFDIEGDEETHLNFTPPEQTQIPSTLIPSPGVEEEPPKPDEIQEQHPEDHVNQQSDEGKEANQPHQDQQRQGPPRRRQRRAAVSVMDYEQTIIPGHMYQSWLQDASDVVSRRGRKRKHMGTMPTMKIANLMELPSVVLIGGLFANGTGEIHYPPPLLKLSIRSAQPPQNSPSGRASPPQPSSSSPPERIHYQDPEGFPLEEINSGVGSHSLEVPIEKQRTIFADKRMPTDIVTEELGTYFMNNGVTITEANMIVTPGNSGNEVRSIPSSGSGQDFVSNNSEVNSGRSKKRHYSSSHGGSGLEPVAEENSWRSPNFKLSRLSENGPTPENDLLVETGPTQTQDHPIIIQPIDQLTDSIRMQLKMHFDTPESPKVLSLNQLAGGMNRKRAACLFYQTCVLASREFARVEQKVAYGDILVSRGAKM